MQCVTDFDSSHPFFQHWYPSNTDVKIPNQKKKITSPDSRYNKGNAVLQESGSNRKELIRQTLEGSIASK